ncbi:hypothetical protein ALC62_14641, partial [Cyphomyrmex costatus]
FQKKARSRPKIYSTEDSIPSSFVFNHNSEQESKESNGLYMHSLCHRFNMHIFEQHYRVSSHLGNEVEGPLSEYHSRTNTYNGKCNLCSRSRKAGFSAPKLNFPDTKAKVPKHLDGTSGTKTRFFSGRRETVENESHDRRLRTSLTEDNIRAVRDFLEIDRRIIYCQLLDEVKVAYQTKR